MKLRRLVLISVLAALTIILNIVDSLIPISFIPGIRLGLANIVIIVTLYLLGEKEALVLVIFKVILASLLRGSFLSIPFFMALGGSSLSFVMILIFKRINGVGIIGVSVIGSVFHITGQILVAMVLMNTTSLIYYLAILLSISLLTGIAIGWLGEKLVKLNIFERLSKHK